MDIMNKVKNGTKKIAKSVFSKFMKIIGWKILLICILILTVTLVLFSGFSYVLNIIDGVEDEGNIRNTPGTVSPEIDNAIINEEGNIERTTSTEELWNAMVEAGNNIDEYLDDYTQLNRMINAELVTQSLDLREDPTEEINWDEMSLEDEVPGIINLNRALSDGTTITMTYVDSDTFYEYIEIYETTGLEEDKQNVLQHFTINNTYTIVENTEESQNESNEDSIDTLFWPTDGTTISSYYGYRGAIDGVYSTSNFHKGIDIAVGVGTNVYACEGGTVTNAFYSDTGGYMIVIDHGNGYISRYLHNSSLLVSAGDTVTKGQIISLSGNTGSSSGPHLHFDISYNGSTNYVDPLTFSYSNGMGNGEEGIGISNGTVITNYDYKATIATFTEEYITYTSTDPNVESWATSEFSVSTTQIDYVELVEPYSMPFQYLWAMLVISEDVDFVMDLAGLVYDSEFIVTIYDSLETDYNEVIYSYNYQYDTDAYTHGSGTYVIGEIDVYDENGDIIDTYPETRSVHYSDSYQQVEVSELYTITTETIIKTNNIDIALSKADCWIVDMTQSYEYLPLERIDDEPVEPITFEDIENSLPEYTTENEDRCNRQAVVIEMLESQYPGCYGINIDINTETTYTSTINRLQTESGYLEFNDYIEQPQIVIEKVEKYPEEGEENFVSLVIHYSQARAYLKSVDSWLFEIIESNEDTADMLDLTKYLFYNIYDDDSYGVLTMPELNLSIYDFGNSSSSSSNGGTINFTGSTIEEKVWNALRGAGYSEIATAGAMGNIYAESRI